MQEEVANLRLRQRVPRKQARKERQAAVIEKDETESQWSPADVMFPLVLIVVSFLFYRLWVYEMGY